MPRPRKCRHVGQGPVHTFYKPQGVPLEQLTGVNLPVEGLEALRLADAEALPHEDAAERMGISRPTFSRVLADARRIVARALSNGWAIHIDGGSYRVLDGDMPARGQGRRRSGKGCGGPGAGREG